MKPAAAKQENVETLPGVALRPTLIPNELAMIGHVEVSLEAKLGTITMTVERLFGLNAGDVVAMDALLDAPLVLLLNGKAVARGELLAVDDHYGIRILDVA
ncbi:MAG: flagellar motor switch protein FliN [Lysobacteraceae bacterium]|nr:MAG: flagellar motor switch protein FliN [Xanthomonadaceae bacterium]